MRLPAVLYHLILSCLRNVKYMVMFVHTSGSSPAVKYQLHLVDRDMTKSVGGPPCNNFIFHVTEVLNPLCVLTFQVITVGPCISGNFCVTVLCRNVTLVGGITSTNQGST